MREQHCLVKHTRARLRPNGERDARDFRKPPVRKRKRHKCGARFSDPHPELCGNVIGKTRGPHFRNGFAASGKDQVFAGQSFGALPLKDVQGKDAVFIAHRSHRGFQPKLCPCRFHQIAQHGDDILGRGIAKQLTQGFFVIGDVVALNQINKIPLGIPCQCGFREMGVFGQEISCTGVDIREITPPTT